jgi:hypothetical protein
MWISTICFVSWKSRKAGDVILVESENLRTMDADCVNTFLMAGEDWCPSLRREGIEDISLIPPFVLFSPQHIGWCPPTLRMTIYFTEWTKSYKY